MAFESVKKVAEADFPTRWGAFRILGFQGRIAGHKDAAEANAGNCAKDEVEELVALVMGDIHSAPPIVRIHSQCLTGDVFGSLRCDCRLQLEMALGKIANVELGFAADCRGYELPAEVLKLLGVKSVRLMTNNPEKVSALESAGIVVAERLSAEVEPQESFAGYLKTKQEKMGHILEMVVTEDQSE